MRSSGRVHFDGKDLLQWRSQKGGGPAPWLVENGYMQVAPGSGGIETTGQFGDCQLHVEWMEPTTVTGESQDRGNSGVYLMGLYEVQVLESHEGRTYADGMAGALYGQYPPLVNAARPQGQWQAYDIVFRGPRFDAGGGVTRPARMTVLFNGVVVSVVGISSFVTTLGVLFTLDGLTLIISHATQVTTPGTSVVKVGTFAQIFGGGTYSELFWAIGITIILQVTLSFTRWGIYTVAVGGNRLGAAEAGVRTKVVMIRNFVLCAGLAGFVGILEAVCVVTITLDSSGFNAILF